MKIKQTIQNNETDVDSLIDILKDNKLILKSEQRFRSERHNVFIQKLIKLHWVLTMIKEYNQIQSIETYAYGTNENIIQFAILICKAIFSKKQ